MVGKIDPEIKTASSLNRQVTTTAASFLLASLAVSFVDVAAVAFSTQSGPLAGIQLLQLFPKIGLAFPLLASAIAGLAALARHKMTTGTRHPILASWNADLIIAVPFLPLISDLFSGPAISSSAMRYPLWAGTVATTYLLVRTLRLAAGAAGKIASAGSAKARLFYSLASIAAVLCAVPAGRMANAGILPGLYDSFHQLLTLGVVGLSAAGIYVLLQAQPIKPRGKRAAVVLLISLALSWVGGSVLAGSAALGRRLVVDNCPMIGPFLGPVLVGEKRLLLAVTGSRNHRSTTSGKLPFAFVQFDENSKKNDVLLISVDALRADVLDPKGRFGATADRLIKISTSSQFFTKAYAPSNYTPYSIPGMALGRVPQKGLDIREQDSIASPFKDAGYRTEFFFTAHEYASLEQTDLWPLASQGFFFDRYHPEYHTAQTVLARVQAILDKPGSPVFVWLHLSDVHSPFLKARDKKSGPGKYPATYQGQLNYLDTVLGPFIDRLNTEHPSLVWALTSDHGEALGEHNSQFHGSTLYAEQVKVPLLIGGHGVPRGTVSTPVSTTDLGSTLLKLAGATLTPTTPTLPLDDNDRGYPVLLTGRDEQCGVVQGNMKFMADSRKGTAAMYDLKKDPLEQQNLIATQPDLAREFLKLTVDLGCVFSLETVVF